MMRFLLIIIVLIVVVSCNKQEVEPVGFFEENYYTVPDQDQSFVYYFDDGELVAGGLDEYMAAVYSSAGTFQTEQFLLLQMRTVFDDLPDSIVPWTYFMGLNYNDTLLKPVTFDINTSYPFNNFAHSSFENELFYGSNIENMRLVKVSYTDPTGLYYDPGYEFSYENFDYYPADQKISFQTQSSNEIYALCYVEKPFSDSLTFAVNSGGGTNTQDAKYEGFRNDALLEGVVFENNVIKLDYSPKSNVMNNNTDEFGWQLQEIHLITPVTQEGIVPNDQIQLELLIKEKISEVTSNVSRLKLTSNTTVELVNWPDVGEYGEIVFDGFMEREATQSAINIDLSIHFKRLR